jgi:periplasmic protein CpxP/Spy
MKKIQHLIIAACLATLGLSAGAQTPQPGVVAPSGPTPMMAPGGGRPMMQEHMARMQQRRAQRDAALKQILQITPAQEAAWNTWVEARRPPTNMQRPNRAEFAQLTTPERIDRMRARRAERIAEMDRRADATKTFYAALTPAQQKAFDALSARRMERGSSGGRQGGWMHRG